jgi:predicted DNA-binding transcriptional regulator AlpA
MDVKMQAPNLQAVLTEIKKLRAEIKAPPKRLLTVEQTAHYLGLAPKTIRNGLGPKAQKPFPVKPVKLAGKVLFRLEDLDRYIDSLTGEGQANVNNELTKSRKATNNKVN